MAVFERLSDPELRSLCSRFGLHLELAEGVPQGSINTNYRLTCGEGRHFLRYTTVRKAADLDFEAGLLAHLKQGGFPCPEPLLSSAGAPFVERGVGFVSVFPYLPGEELSSEQVTCDHARSVGGTLGKMHRLAASYGGARQNPYGAATLRRWIEEIESAPLEAEVRAAVRSAAEALPEAVRGEGLPQGPIHADLFRDNVKWLGDRIAAVFDFEMACVDEYALDLGIALDVWTFGGAGFDRPRVRAFVAGYRAERPLRAEEAAALHARALYGAVRFTLSRIRDFHLSKAEAGALQKKPWHRYAQRMQELRRLGAAGLRELCGV